MAAGLSLPSENLEEFRRKINECCTLTEEDFIPKIKIDIAMPVGYPNASLIRELNLFKEKFKDVVAQEGVMLPEVTLEEISSPEGMI